MGKARIYAGARASNVDIKVNDYATVLGQNGGLEITATEIAEATKTIE